MSILIHNCTAVLMDEAGTVLPNAYVVVEGTKDPLRQHPAPLGLL